MGPTIRAAEAKDCPRISLLNAVLQAKHVAAAQWLFKDAVLVEADIVALLACDDTIMRVAVYDGRFAGYIYAQFPKRR